MISHERKIILDYIELDENHAMFEIPIPKDWADHSIGELDIRKKFIIMHGWCFFVAPQL